jgi:type III secretion system YscQ/HrcQ family protein
MNNNYKNTLPFKLRSVTAAEQRGRGVVTEIFPGGPHGVLLEKMGAVLTSPKITLKFHSIDPTPTPPPTATVSMALSAGPRVNPERFVLILPLNGARKIVDRTLQRTESVGRGFLTSGEQGALLYALDRAGGDWIRAGGTPFVIRGFLADSSQIFDYLRDGAHWCVAGLIQGPGFPNLRLDLWFNHPASGALNSNPKQKKLFQKGAHDLPVTMRIAVGVTTLTLGDIRNLDVDDLVILDRLCHPCFGSGRSDTVISSGKWNRRCRWEDPRTLIVLENESRENPMVTNRRESRSVVAPFRDPADDDCAEMEIAVHVEIGQIKMTVAEAATLLPGTTLSLDRDVGPKVSLRAGGKLIAGGELVEYAGQLAVEVKEIL